MKTLTKVAVGLGAGLGAYLLFVPKALATEDVSGTEVDTSKALPPPPPPPQPVTPAPKAPGAPAPAVAPPAPAAAPPAPAAAPPAPAADSIGRRAVEILLRYANKPESAEQPWPHYPNKPYPSTNRGPLVDEILRGVYNDAPKLVGKPWCARTVRWAYEKAAQELGLPKPFAGIKSTLAMVDDWKNKFKDYHVKEPRTGNVALIQNSGVNHATLVSRVDGNIITTVEGNHKDALMTVERPRSKFDVFVDVEAYIRKAGAPKVAGLDLLGAENV